MGGGVDLVACIPLSAERIATVVHPMFYQEFSRELNERNKIIIKLPYKPMISLFDKKEIAIMLKTNGSRWSSSVFALATLLNYALMVICLTTV